MSQIKINNQIIGENYPTYFIAEITSNHDGDFIKSDRSNPSCCKGRS